MQMPELEADYIIQPPEGFDCSFEINASGTVWGAIFGDINSQTDLKNALDSKADDTEITAIDGRLDTIESTLSGYGNIVTHNVPEFATAAQGALADSAVQPSDLNNYVPNTRTVNGKALSANIALNYSDVGALSSTTTINDLTTSAQQNALNSGITSTDVTLIGTALQPNDNITELNNNAGYITGITSTDVTNALGYTPYNSTNPNGYITGITSTDVTDALGYTPYNSTNPNGYSSTLNGLTDVNLSNPTQGQNLTYDAVNQKWINSSTTATVGWGGITGTLSDQTDLQNALNDKQDVIDANNKLSASYISGLGAVATSNDYDDLTNKPTIPSAQVNSDWDANSGVAQILNKPTLSTVATSGSYNDLNNKPTIPTVNNATLTIQKNGTNVQTFTANASSDVTANITVPTDTSDLTNSTLANVSLSNLYTDGNNRLHALKGYTESGQVYSDTTLYNDIYAQYSTATTTGTDTIITDNYTVVGSLTINDGIASGFGQNNYISTGSFVNNLGDYDNWEIEVHSVTASSTSGTYFGTLIHSTIDGTQNTQSIHIDMNNSHVLRVYLKAIDGSWIYYISTTPDTFALNSQLDVKIKFTGTQYIIQTRISGQDWKTQLTANNSKKLYKTNLPILFGSANTAGNSNWGGSINLYGIRFIGNNKLIYACKCQIPYNISDNGNKIADVQYRPDVAYANTLGYKSSYFSIDTTNQNVTLPYEDIYGLITQSFNYNYTRIQGYDGTATQTLKHVSGVLQWVTDTP